MELKKMFMLILTSLSLVNCAKQGMSGTGLHNQSSIEASKQDENQAETTPEVKSTCMTKAGGDYEIKVAVSKEDGKMIGRAQVLSKGKVELDTGDLPVLREGNGENRIYKALSADHSVGFELYSFGLQKLADIGASAKVGVFLGQKLAFPAPGGDTVSGRPISTSFRDYINCDDSL